MNGQGDGEGLWNIEVITNGSILHSLVGLRPFISENIFVHGYPQHACNHDRRHPILITEAMLSSLYHNHKHCLSLVQT